MIINSKQQQLTFEKGITNVPSDLICSDNTLEECVGMTYDNGEHRVIQKPLQIMANVSGRLLYVHKFDNKERYICLNGSQLYWRRRTQVVTNGNLMTSDGISQVTAIGKTLIVSGTDGLHYFLWKDDAYVDLGELPDPKFEFFTTSGDRVRNSSESEGIIVREFDSSAAKYSPVKKPSAYNDLIYGLYAKNKKGISEKKGFCLPYFVRTAIKLYDGTYTHISQPILMFPTVTENSYAAHNHFEPEETDILYMYTYYNKLAFTQKQDFSKWSDIVKDITVFISSGIEMHDLGVDCLPTGRGESGGYEFPQTTFPATDQVVAGLSGRHFYASYKRSESFVVEDSFSIAYNPLVKRATSEIERDIRSTSVFYKLCDVGLQSIVNQKDIGEYIDAHTLENLTTQEQLQYDDYFSRNKLVAEFIYPYNSRLNLANVKRGFFDGFDFFMPLDHSSTDSYYYRFRVQITTDSGLVVVQHTSGLTSQKQGFWFFYPDSRASRVIIERLTSKDQKDGFVVCNEALTEHPGLNGAYFFKGLPSVYNEETDASGSDMIGPASDNPQELLSNYVITSEVNNPLVFKAEGYNMVGVDRIVGMASLTQALSQGQFGQYPLIVFSGDGIWAMSVGSTGLYQSIHPMSREVCVNGKSITQTDGAIFFASKKGLMVVVGGDVRCVSEQLSGREGTFDGEVPMYDITSIVDGETVTTRGGFTDYLEGCFMAYDYRDSLLWIFNSNEKRLNREYCYIYSIKSGTFSKYKFTNAMVGTVNSYPDYLIQQESVSQDGEVKQQVFSLLNRRDINTEDTKYNTLMITRPMKFENGLALKSLIDVRNIHSMKGKVGLRVFVSNDAVHWWEKTSNRGTPWKYFRFRYDFTDVKATDTFSGAVITTVERRTDKLR